MKRSRVLIAAVGFFLSIAPFIYVGDLLARPAMGPVGPRYLQFPEGVEGPPKP